MANTASAKKRIRQNERRTARNKAANSRLRTYIKKVETSLAAGSSEEAKTAYAALQPQMLRAVGKGLLHRNTVARKLSRLTKRIKAAASPA